MPHAANIIADPDMEKWVTLLGGQILFGRPLSTVIEAHDTIKAGFPSQALIAFVRNFPTLGREQTIDKVAGVSLRTFQRHKRAGTTGRLSCQQSGRLYTAARIVAKAVDVFGSCTAAERFLDTPAAAFDRQRPIDLFSTFVGAEFVERHIARVDLGIYT